LDEFPLNIQWLTKEIRLSALTDAQLDDLSSILPYLSVVPQQTALGLHPVSVITYDWKKIGEPEYVTVVHIQEGDPAELFDILHRYLDNAEIMLLTAPGQGQEGQELSSSEESGSEEDQEEKGRGRRVFAPPKRKSELKVNRLRLDDDDDSDRDDDEEDEGDIGLMVKGNRRDEIISILEEIYDPSNYILMDQSRFGYAFDLDPVPDHELEQEHEEQELEGGDRRFVFYDTAE
jgi:hypothetical protein